MMCLAGTVAGFAQVSYTIDGKVNASDEGKTVNLSSLMQQGGMERADSAVVKGNAFTMKGQVKEPGFYILFINKSKTRFTPIYLENGSAISFETEGNTAKLTKGSATNKALSEFMTAYSSINKEQESLYKRYQELMEQYKGKLPKAQEDSINAVDDAINKKTRDVVLSQINKSLNTYAPALFLKTFGESLTLDDKKAILAKQGPFQNSPLTKQVKEEVMTQELTSEGKPYIDFTMNDIDGKPHKLSEYVGKGKYVLLDFWASWCGPCRAEMPNVKKVYETYKDKGFDIVGISLDSNKAAWQKGIADLGITWHQLSDLKGWRNAGAAKYGVRAIPATFLLDPKGKIIGKDLRGEELGQKLAEVLK